MKINVICTVWSHLMHVLVYMFSYTWHISFFETSPFLWVNKLELELEYYMYVVTAIAGIHWIQCTNMSGTSIYFPPTFQLTCADE